MLHTEYRQKVDFQMVIKLINGKQTSVAILRLISLSKKRKQSRNRFRKTYQLHGSKTLRYR